MEKSFPFNAKHTGTGFDRSYSADDWAAERAAYIANGILTAEALKVTPAGGMQIAVAAGNACVGGRTYFNTAPLIKTLAGSSPTKRRIDLIVLRLDTEAREMKVAIKSSEEATVPMAPKPTVTDTVTEIPLAEVAIDMDAAAITEDDVLDRREMAKYPLNYDAIYEEFVSDLKDRLGLEEIADLGVFAKLLTDGGAGDLALFDDGVYKPVPRVIVGTYPLTSATDGSVHVNLGLKPKAVYCCRLAHPPAAYENGEIFLYGGFAQEFYGACTRYDEVSGGFISLVSVTDTGFKVTTNRNNTTGYKYMGATYQFGGVDGGNDEYRLSYIAIV